MDTNTVYNDQDEAVKDIEDLSKVTNLQYGNDVLHPTANGIEFNEAQINGKQAYVPNPVDLRYASVFFEPKIGCCTSNPPFQLAYKLVTREVDKVVFKYELAGWVNWYAIRVDAPENGCDVNGTPCVLTQIPYATYDIKRAQDLIISYVTEVLALLNQSYAIVYFDSNTAFKISCTYDENRIEYGVPKLISTEVTDITGLKTISAIIETGIVPAAIEIQRGIKEHNQKDQIQVPVYLHVSKYPTTSPLCLMTSASHQNHGDYASPMTKFESSVKEELTLSMLSFKDYTVI